MFRLFMGNLGGHGTYTVEEKTPGKTKSVIKKSARTIREPPTPELWQQHLDGKRPLGIVPVNGQGTCWWGVVDVDRYDIDHAAIVRQIEKLRLPLFLCRSKSGGAHLFVFLQEPAPAELLIERLKEMAGVLGFGDCEIFPKQTVILEDRGDLGNWLNMPYFESERGTRYAVTADGRGLSIGTFLDTAEAGRITVDKLESLRNVGLTSDPDLAEAPPCLQYMCGVGIPEGSKNNTIFALAILAKKMRPEGWEQLLDEWNRKYVISPALSSEEMSDLFRRLRKKDYSYKCHDQPLVSHCDSKACRTRRYGVGSASAPDITSISILDTQPPLFFVYLTSGGTVECESDDLLTSRNFQRAVLIQLKQLIPLCKNEEWQSLVSGMLEVAVMIEAPREVSTTGTLEEYLTQFCTDRHAAQDRDEILLGKPWLDDESNRYYFRLSDLMGHLEKNRFRELRRGQIVARIRDLGGDHHFFNLRGRGTNVFFVPKSAFSTQSLGHGTPRVGEGEEI
jgi:hypothetical protein